MSRRRWIGAGVVLAIVLLNGALLWNGQRHQGVEDARAAATKSARAALPTLLSYTYSDLDPYRTAAERMTTGDFRTELLKLIDTQLLSQAKADQVTIRTTVEAASVVSASANRVRLLVFVDQWRTTKTSKSPGFQGNRLAVTLEERSGRWLVSDLDPV